MSASEVGIRFSTTDIPPSGYRDIKLIPSYTHPGQLSSGTVTVLRVELKGPKVGPATLSLISAVKGGGVDFGPLQLSHPSYNYDEEIVRYELDRTIFNKEELIYLRVQNGGEVPAHCSGTLFVSTGLAEPEPKVPGAKIESSSKRRSVSALLSAVPAGQTAKIEVDPFAGVVEGVSYNTLSIFLSSRAAFELVDVQLFTTEPSIVRGVSILRPKGEIARCVVRQGTKLLVSVKNLSKETAPCRVVLEGEDLREGKNIADSAISRVEVADEVERLRSGLIKIVGEGSDPYGRQSVLARELYLQSCERASGMTRDFHLSSDGENHRGGKTIADSVLDEMVNEASGPDLPNPSDDEEVGLVEGLLRKCRGWFAEGFAAGVAGREGRAGVADLASEAPTVRDSLRVLAMQVASVAEIPLVAARMYWEQVAGLGGGARRSTVLSFGKCTVQPGESVKVVVTSSKRYRPTGIVVSGHVAPHFTITDVIVGDESQSCIDSGELPCSLFNEFCRPPLALDVDEAGPGRDVTIWVRNESSEPREFSGAILADILIP